MCLGVKVFVKEIIFIFWFYIIDFDEMVKMDIFVNEDELIVILEEFCVDYNCYYFVRDKEFV